MVGLSLGRLFLGNLNSFPSLGSRLVLITIKSKKSRNEKDNLGVTVQRVMTGLFLAV